MAKIKAVFFDMGGVMVPSSVNKISKIIEEIFEIKEFSLLNPRHMFFSDLFHYFETGKISEKKLWEEFARKINKKLPSSWPRIFNEPLKKAKIRSKMKRLVFYLKEKGTKTAILSNVSEPFAQRHFRLGHYQIFDHLILSHKVGFQKPDIRIYHHALSVVKVQPHESVFIDDKEENVEAGKKLGMKGIIYRNTDQVWREIENLL